MTIVPPSPYLPVEYLAAGFENVTNSYKFYWFLALLDQIQERQSPDIPILDLLVRMVSSVWYSTNYFRLSFGKQDQLGLVARQIDTDINLSAASLQQKIAQHLVQDPKLARDIKRLGL